MDVFGIRLVGFNAENGQKFLYTMLLVSIIWFLGRGLRWLVRRILTHRSEERVQFWARQVVNLGTTVVLILGVLSIWFDDPTRLATALGLVTAGLAFALQKVVTAIAGYFVILRGNNFSVGDRITMGGVRGDVIGLGFIQTTIMEMGQPPAVQASNPAMWVRSRQYTGRVVTVSNDKIFDEPIYNYTRDFPFLWEEISLVINFGDDRTRAEQILLHAAQRHAAGIDDAGRVALAQMQTRFAVQSTSTDEKVYLRIANDGIELTVRFVTEARGVRDVKDAMSREIIDAFDDAGIGIASTTIEIVANRPDRAAAG